MRFCIDNIPGWVDVETSGIPDFVISFDDTIPDGFIDKSTMVLCNDFKDLVAEEYDYCIIRDLSRDVVALEGGFNNLTPEGKDCALIFTRNVSDVDAIPFLMSKGMTYDKAVTEYIKLSAIDMRYAAESYGIRIDSPEFTSTIIKYIGVANAGLFLDDIRTLVSDLKDSAILGTDYGNTKEGIMNFIEDTGTYSSAGFSRYFNLPDDQDKLLDCRKEIKDIIYLGYSS